MGDHERVYQVNYVLLYNNILNYVKKSLFQQIHSLRQFHLPLFLLFPMLKLNFGSHMSSIMKKLRK